MVLATRNWAGRLQFPIRSKKRNVQYYYNSYTQEGVYDQLLKMMVIINKYS